MNEWLTPAQAARRLAVSESTVWRLLRRGQLASVKVGGRRRIRRAALAAVARPVREAAEPHQLAPLTLDDALFRLAGRFRSDGEAPGASDKHAYLGDER